MHELTNLCETPLHQLECHLGRDTLRYIRLLASYTSRSARYAARRASNLRRGFRAHDRQLELWGRLGIVPSQQKDHPTKLQGYKD